MWRVPRSHPPARTTPDRPGRHHRFGVSCQSQIPGIPHLHLCRYQTGKRFHVQVRRGRTGENPRNRGVPLHHRSLHHADQGLRPRQRAPDGTAEQQDAGNPRRYLHRNAHFVGAKHQEGNPHLSGISLYGGITDRIPRSWTGIGHLHVSDHRPVPPRRGQGRILLGHTLLVDLPVAGTGRRGGFHLCIRSFCVLLAGCICFLFVLDNQGSIRPGETCAQRLVPQESPSHVQVLSEKS